MIDLLKADSTNKTSDNRITENEGLLSGGAKKPANAESPQPPSSLADHPKVLEEDLYIPLSENLIIGFFFDTLLAIFINLSLTNIIPDIPKKRNKNVEGIGTVIAVILAPKLKGGKIALPSSLTQEDVK